MWHQLTCHGRLYWDQSARPQPFLGGGFIVLLGEPLSCFCFCVPEMGCGQHAVSCVGLVLACNGVATNHGQDG